jgi:hypothetical protein
MELHDMLSGRPSCLHVLIFIVLIISIIIFTSTLLVMLRTSISLEALLFVGITGLITLLLLIANCAILYFQCCSNKKPIAMEIVVPTATVAPTAVAVIRGTAPIIGIDKDGSFVGSNPLRV